jgi:prophage antirepressor-like protein
MEKNEILTPEVFQFSSTKQEVRSLLVENEAWLVAKDVCDVLGLTNTAEALRGLDDDEKLTGKVFVSGTDLTSEKLKSGQNRKMWLINESGFFALVLRSNKPEAKAFRKWVTSEVLPTIRRKGYYGSQKKENDYIDARDVPYNRKEFNGFQVRFIELDGEMWLSLNDLHAAIGSRTDSTQAARKLNHKQTLARKIWLFGNTNPSWFTNMLGSELILSGSRTITGSRQLQLNFGGQN